MVYTRKLQKNRTSTVLNTTNNQSGKFEPDIDCNEKEAKNILQRVEKTRFPNDLRVVVDTYQDVLDDRNEYQWKWLYAIFGKVTLSCVPEVHMTTLQEVKTMLSMYNVLLDDIAEEYNDKETFWELAKVVYPGTNPDWGRTDINHDYAKVAKKVWGECERKLQKAPRYDEFVEPFRFELRQAFESMEYSRLSMNCEGMANLTETWTYGPHNMMIHLFGDTDLMFSPSFSRDDYDVVRETMLTFQEMWRISNWVATWEREIREHDYSAGVVVAALQEDVISRDMLERFEDGTIGPENIIGRIKAAGIEQAFLQEWEQRRDELRQREYSAETVDIHAFIDAMELQMKCRLSARGKMKGENNQ